MLTTAGDDADFLFTMHRTEWTRERAAFLATVAPKAAAWASLVASGACIIPSVPPPRARQGAASPPRT